VIQLLQKATGITSQAIEAQVRRNEIEPFQPFVVKADLDSNSYLLLRENLPTMPGVRLQLSTTRHYTSGAALSHILGYVGKLDPEEYNRLRDKGYLLDDVIGKTGTESVDEKWLRGVNGTDVVETDARGAIVKHISTTNPVPGDNVYLGVDLGLQREVVSELQQSMDDVHKRLGAGHGEAGAAVVMNPQTGEIMSLVSLPAYDLNQFSQGITVAQYQALISDARNPLLNRAIAGLYPPGSTFKPVTAAAGLSSGAISRNSTIFCPGFLRRGASTFSCWSRHGTQNVIQAIAHSCDVFFYTVADRVGDQVMSRVAKDFGLNHRTGIDLPGEAQGIAPDRDWKKKYFAEALAASKDPAWADSNWYEGDTITYGIGQSFVLVTPLQDLEWTVTVANGGNYMRPQVTGRITDVNGRTVRPFGPVIDHKVQVPQDILAIIREGLREATERGGTSGFIWGQKQFAGVPEPGGKTGTAQYGAADGHGNYPLHAWYTSFAPAVDPEVSVVVFVQGGGEGHEASAPVAARILSYYFGHRAEIKGG
jgi:penicillin-binding protein 2